jgi:SAM-dependent methyltransferase
MGGDTARCWVCDAAGLTLRKRSDVERVTPGDFAISDARYGRTAAIYQCRRCGFLQCADLSDVVAQYENLEDPGYEASRPQRVLQARGLLETIRRVLGRDLRDLRLLDVGAGSGPLVEEALAWGIQAEGVEPSAWLGARAASRGLPVHQGTLPHANVRGSFDIVTLIDVIEHALRPLDLLRAAAACARPGGLVVLVTPDVRSLPARVMGWRWWHYRVAHVGYFSPETLDRLVRRAGLDPYATVRPGWVLPLSYLLERVEQYLPSFIRVPRGAWMSRMAVPFNLRDSLMVFARRGPTADALAMQEAASAE